MTDLTSNSWYLDPLVARQKAAVIHALVVRWAKPTLKGTVLKTDLFEEANGEDHILDTLPAWGSSVVGMDHDAHTVAGARRRLGSSALQMTVSDLCAMNFLDESFDLIMSTSTLDHFESRAEFVQALEELVRVVRPGGTMILLLDNPWNPAYWPLRLLCHRVTSFSLGYTMTLRGFRGELESLGLRTLGTDYAIHNLRMVSTLLFLLLRKLLGGKAEAVIAAFIRLFEMIGTLPTKPLTACFSVVCVEKPAPDKIPA